jgi:hypothetical protein
VKGRAGAAIAALHDAPLLQLRQPLPGRRHRGYIVHALSTWANGLPPSIVTILTTCRATSAPFVARFVASEPEDCGGRCAAP